MPAISLAAGAESKPCNCPGCINRPALKPDRWERHGEAHSFASQLKEYEKPGKMTGARLAKRATARGRKAQDARQPVEATSVAYVA